jgi:hypothetical protein
MPHQVVVTTEVANVVIIGAIGDVEDFVPS